MKLHYKSQFACVLFLFSIISCTNQKKENSTKKARIDTTKNQNVSSSKTKNTENEIEHTTEKISKARLKKYKNNGYIFTENDSVFELRDLGDSFMEIKYKIGKKQLTIHHTYDKEKRVLINKGNFMFDCAIGINISYDLKGNSTAKRNYDDDFPFTFANLKEKLLKDFAINIEDKTLNLTIDRSLTPPVYTICLYNELGSQCKHIIIDGITGETIEDKIVRIIEG